MIESGLSPAFWVEGYQHGELYSELYTVKKPKQAYEIWIGKVNHFRVFGSKVIYLDKQSERDKFKPRGKEGIFLEYAEENKGCRIWSSDNKKVIISRDVKFISEEKHRLDKYNDFIHEKQFEDSDEEKEKESIDDYTKTSRNVEILQDLIANGNDEPDDLQEDDQLNTCDEDDNVYELNDEPRENRRSPDRQAFIGTGARGRPRKIYQLIREETAIGEEEE